MREIKFRAWDTEHQRWLIKAELENVGHYEFGQRVPNLLILQDERNENIILSQFTGLKDKNGKDVFEGDIVEGNPLGSTGVRRGQVIWMNDGWYVSDETERDQEKRLHDDFFTKVEVLGNIYENANLLGYEG